MNFQGMLENECYKVISRFERYARELREDDKRRQRRSGSPSRGIVNRPSYWSVDIAFNPYHVRSASDSISRAIQKALKSRDYRPYNPVKYEVPKADGSMRAVSVFSLADSTVSRRVYLSLLEKNKSRLSSYSYAYRDDLTVHDAVQHIGADLGGSTRMFVAEYDFSKYFDTIAHDYIWSILDRKNFLVTKLERSVLSSFLSTASSLQDQATYKRFTDTAAPKQDYGLPQGTSISLFLANLAAWDLDRSLERLGVGFARYADDTLIWSPDYGKICEAAEILNSKSAEIGSSLNLDKSHGISIFTPNGRAEFSAKDHIDFVGYRFGHGRIGMRASVVTRVKERVAYLVYSNLLEPLKHGSFVPQRISGSIDLDYQVMLMQIRRYLYGNLTEDMLAKLSDGRARKINFPGVMSFFPLIDDEAQLKALDGWLLHTISSSLKKRAKLFIDFGVSATELPAPHGLSDHELLGAKGLSWNGSPVDLRVPSFVRIARLIRKAAAEHGANVVGRRGGPQFYRYGQ